MYEFYLLGVTLMERDRPLVILFDIKECLVGPTYANGDESGKALLS